MVSWITGPDLVFHRCKHKFHSFQKIQVPPCPHYSTPPTITPLAPISTHPSPLSTIPPFDIRGRGGCPLEGLPQALLRPCKFRPQSHASGAGILAQGQKLTEIEAPSLASRSESGEGTCRCCWEGEPLTPASGPAELSVTQTRNRI